MSYCRFSSDNFQCDMYCYPTASGDYTLHIAATRYPEPSPPWPHKDTEELWQEYTTAIEAWRKNGLTNMVKIDLPHAGETRRYKTLIDLRADLILFKGMGYRIPDSAFEHIDQELKDDEARQR